MRVTQANDLFLLLLLFIAVLVFEVFIGLFFLYFSIVIIMENELSEINGRFQSGKHNQAIGEIQTLIKKFSLDDEIYRAHARLGHYINYMGKHSEAVDAWAKALSFLEDENGNVDHLAEDKFVDWINISLEKARVMHRQGNIHYIQFIAILFFLDE